MAPPSKGQLTVAIERLRGAGNSWHDVASDLGKASERIEPLKITRLEAGIFQVPYQAYLDAAQFIQDRTKEGATQATNVGYTLKSNADTYQREEDNNTHRLTGLY